MGRHSRETETSDFVAMMSRIIVAYGDRIAADPVALVHLADIERQLSDQAARGVFQANQGSGYSMNEIARMVGVSRQAVQQRVHRGESVYARIQTARGAGPLFRLADIRRRRAELAQAAGVQDRTGSVRELRARAS
jgi:predicted DNA-binding protein YlxM (UPF0122 family)